MHKVLLISLFSLFALNCAPRAAAQEPEGPNADPSAGTRRESPRSALPELTADEKLVADQLRHHVEYLGTKVGERNEGAPWELADAADYIASQIEGMGLPVERQGYETRNVAAQNLAVTISGSERGDQIFLIGAHYDSPPGDKGQNPGGSATAALLTLVSLMKDASLKRTLRFVFFSMGESPHGDGEARGARHYARYLTENSGNEKSFRADDEIQTIKRGETVGILLLDRMAAFEPADARGAPLAARLTLSPGSQVVRDLLLEDFDSDVFTLHESKLADTGADSDLLAFHQEGIVGVAFRGTGQDAQAVQYEELSRVVMQIRRSIGRVAGERPTNDGMLTPLSEQIR